MKNKSEYALLIVLAFLMIFGLIGWAVSPEDESGQPLLLLPGVKEVEEYRRKANNWTEDMKVQTDRLTILLNVNAIRMCTLFADRGRLCLQVLRRLLGRHLARQQLALHVRAEAAVPDQLDVAVDLLYRVPVVFGEVRGDAHQPRRAPVAPGPAHRR